MSEMSDSNTDAELKTVNEAASALGVSERTIWRWIRSGSIASRKVGRRVLVQLSAPPPHSAREAAKSYGREPRTWSVVDSLEPDVWPFTLEKIEERRRLVKEQRGAAFAEMDGFAAQV